MNSRVFNFANWRLFLCFRLLETRDIADFDSLIKTELNPATEAVAAIAPATISKPSRPGKGRAKVAKFQAEED